MIRLVVVGEGQTEESFVRDVLAPAFQSLGIYPEPRLISTSKGNKGGALSYPRVKKFLRDTLHEDLGIVVTTFFDLYALDTGFPGYEESRRQGTTEGRLAVLEAALQEDVRGAMGSRDRQDRFFPHIQPFEFEALLFSHVERLVEREREWVPQKTILERVVQSAGGPEGIDDGPETCPSAILRQLPGHRYLKTTHGPQIAKSIGLARMEEFCPHFRRWCGRIRALGSLAT